MFHSGTRILYVGPLAATTRHSHHAAQIVVAPQGLDFEDGASGRTRASAAVIPPRLHHRHGACTHAAVLFLDGDDPTSRALARSTEGPCPTLARELVDVDIPGDPTPEQARTLLATILARVQGAVDVRESSGPRHPAVRRMCAYLDRSDAADLDSLAQQAGLSPRQMRHVFAREVGLSMRAYLRWKRLIRAAAAVEAGAGLSAAAAAAGFADCAHLSRVFRDQFGITPTQGLRSIRWRTLDETRGSSRPPP
ncbi:MAG: helix-turn-helix transcriptional regulator [Deltaproteobacteria bacterium]|nr:helix-turn-helix transcriptional regulator [Nannocystaceae bacterium]